MPSGLEELTSLHKLPRFIVGHKCSPKFRSKPPAKLSDLKNLDNLRGALHIEIHEDSKDLVSDRTGANLSSKQRLSDLHIDLTGLYEDVSDHDKAVMESLRPHPNLRKLRIDGFRGQKLPSWVMIEDLRGSLPNLVEIKLNQCERCEQIPSFRQLPFLKRLTLEYLSSVEYMEGDVCDLSSSSSLPTMESLFFPSLQELRLMCMPNLKGWWKVGETVNNDSKEATNKLGQDLSLMSFSNLSKLWIEGCPNLMSMPLSPNVEELTLVDTNKTLSVLKMVTSSPECSSKLKKLSLDNIEDLISLPKECLPRLSLLEVQDTNLVSTFKLKEVFTSLSSLRSLAFCDCHNLESLPKGLEHLTAFEKLDLLNCEELDLSPNEAPGDEDDMPWKALKSLRYLQLREIPKLSAFPRGLQNLANLHSLEVRFIKDLKELPEWISCFQSLEHMELFDCPKLTSLPESFRKLTTLTQL
ncbi:putative disease resistance protein RGA3 [Chenopodium quinoa]|nr:putative disease resistance protein RGA3 [Chenopodium quinoa]